MYKSIVEYQIGSLYDGKVEVPHFNELDDNEIINRAKRLIKYEGTTTFCAESWKVISTDYH